MVMIIKAITMNWVEIGFIFLIPIQALYILNSLSTPVDANIRIQDLLSKLRKVGLLLERTRIPEAAALQSYPHTFQPTYWLISQAYSGSDIQIISP